MKYLSLFSGIGGFEYGIQQSKYSEHFECIGFSEIDKYAKSIYIRHFPQHKDLGDATKIQTEELPDFDFLVGGFPCQAFSVAGKRRGFDDTRGTLFFEIARILKDKRPRYFLLENVRGLLSHNKGETFQTILKVLSDIGYYVKWEVLNSKDFGVPQRRERVFIKGYSRRECGREVLSFRRSGGENTGEVSLMTGELIKEHNRELLCVNKGAAQAQKVYDPQGVPPTLSACGGGDGGKTGLYLVPDERKINVVANTRPSGHWGGNVYDTNGISPTICSGSTIKNGLKIAEEIDSERKIQVVGNSSPSNHPSGRVLSPDGIGRTLTATDYKHPTRIIEDKQKSIKLRESTKKGYKEAKVGDGVELSRSHCTYRRGVSHEDATGALNTKKGSWGTVTSDYRIRKLTPKECERLQAFPDEWTKYGVDGEEISDTQRYKCCGNAVTTSVITAIANEMFDGVFDEDK